MNLKQLLTASGDKRKEPPYDDITARESLSHIRERQAHEQMTSSSPAAFGDGTLDHDYDRIKVVVIHQLQNFGQSDCESIELCKRWLRSLLKTIVVTLDVLL